MISPMRTVTCGCGRPIAIHDEASTAPVKCIYCGALVTPGPAPAASPAKFRCPFCASEIDAGINACPFCNENLVRHAQPPVQPKAPVRGLSMRRCPFCAEQISFRDTVCPYCGNGAGAGPRRVGAAYGVPWETEPNAGFFSRWWRTWSGSMFNAENFFSSMRWDGGIKAPLTYVLGLAGQVVGLALLCGVPFLLLFLASGPRIAHGNAAMATPVILFVAVLYVASYVGAVLVSTFISAAIYHVCALMMGGRGTYEASYRAVCYSFGSNVWMLIPYLGAIVQLVFHFIAMTHALSYAHGITKGRAFVATLLPVLLCCGGLIGFYALLFASMSSGGRF